MVWEVIRPWVSACFPAWRECKPEPSLDVAIQEFDAVLQQCSAGSHEIDRAIERLQKVAARADNWRVISAAFKEGTDRKSMVAKLVRSHLVTCDVGMKHALRVADIKTLGDEATIMLHALTPSARAEILDRWSAPEHASLMMTPSGLVAMDIPGTAFRCPVMDGCISPNGLGLTQREATQFLLARLDDRQTSTTVLDALPEVAPRQRYVVGNLLAKVMGANGSPLSEVDRDALYGVAVIVHDALKGRNDVPVSLGDRFSRFFAISGDHARAAEAHDTVAAFRLQLARNEAGLSKKVPETLRDAHWERAIFNATLSAARLSTAALHLACLETNKPEEIRSCLATARRFRDAGDAAYALAYYARAAQTSALTNAFGEVEKILDEARGEVRGDYEGLCMTYERCAKTFEACGYPFAAALLHMLAVDYVTKLRAQGVDEAITMPLATHHRSCAQECFARANRKAGPEDIGSLLAFTAGPLWGKLISPDGVVGQTAIIRFSEACDAITCNPFDVEPDSRWVLMHGGTQTTGRELYDFVTEGTMRALIASGTRHPCHNRAYQRSDFVRGLKVVNMLYTAGRQSQDAERALRSDVIQQEQESIDDDSSIRGNGVS
ncbi:hypothetical protein [Pandoraea sp. ISTKB]|uniref:hypothetical protein n=1 Tax=Pandoraea sp. ISTKB TaxID=1586708 RepID=UPI000846BD5F|nr:hypothetical protein [Pandoraea sp. ISTKB]ODP32044.1 hypothetical protein A9762_24045 [Pandoraea sp. ISTKB]